MKKVQIGNLIEQAREEQGWSRETLAEKLDIATTTVFRWETNRQGPSFEAVVQLADVLEKRLEYFTGTAAAEPKKKTIKLSVIRQSLECISDDFFDLAMELGDPNDKIWSDLKKDLVFAIEQRRIRSKKA